jgi:hypothetical protein
LLLVWRRGGGCNEKGARARLAEEEDAEAEADEAERGATASVDADKVNGADEAGGAEARVA